MSFSNGRGSRLFRSDIEGMVPLVARDLIDQREKCSVNDPIKSDSPKIINNSAYGDLAFSAYSSSSPSCASAVTSAGRYCPNILYLAILIATRTSVIYGNTDSCFTEFHAPGGANTTLKEMVSEAPKEIDFIQMHTIYI